MAEKQLSNTAESTTVGIQAEDTLLVATSPDLSTDARQEVSVQRFTNLGLGRGIDATSSKPWLEKSSFQVRRVTFDSLVGTEEGGAVEAYEEEVSSVQSLQMGLKASVESSSSQGPVTVGVAEEQTRTISTNRRVLGRRVHNRTVSFREELDRPKGVLPAKNNEQSPTNPIPSQSPWGFNECFCKWILQHLDQQEQTRGTSEREAYDEMGSLSASAAFEQWYREAQELGREFCSRKQLVNLCRDFVRRFGITHYVFSIHLGASEYCAMTEREYFHVVSQNGTGRLDSLVSTSGELKTSKKKKDMKTLSKKIGAIHGQTTDECTVPRGTYAEAVIEAKFKPITTLIHHPQLRGALRMAISRYIDKQCDSSVGPFLISAVGRTGQNVYLRVFDFDMTLQATTNHRLASAFYVIMSNDKVYDFHIIYLRSGNGSQSLNAPFFSSIKDRPATTPIPHFLSTPLTVLGHSSAPPSFELHSKHSDTLFQLHSRLRTHNPVAEPIGSWVEGREAYFINCYGRKFAKDGYLAVKRVSNRDTSVSYQPICVPKQKQTQDFFMVFRLIQFSSIEEAVTEGGGQGQEGSPRRLVRGRPSPRPFTRERGVVRVPSQQQQQQPRLMLTPAADHSDLHREGFVELDDLVSNAGSDQGSDLEPCH